MNPSENIKTTGQTIVDQIQKLQEIISPVEYNKILDLINKSVNDALRHQQARQSRPNTKSLLTAASHIIDFLPIDASGPLREITTLWKKDYLNWKESADRGEENRQTGRTTSMLYNAWNYMNDKPDGFQAVVIIMANWRQCQYAREILSKHTYLSNSFCSILSLVDVARTGYFNWNNLEFYSGRYAGKKVFIDHYAIETHFGPLLKALEI